MQASTALPPYQATFPFGSGSQSLAILYSNRKAPVIKTTIPQASFLSTPQSYNYSNCMLTTFKDAAELVQPEDLASLFFAVAPRYLNVVFAIMRFFFRHVGTGTKAPGMDILKIGQPAPKKALPYLDLLFSSDNEIVFGKSNRNFAFRLSFLLQKPRKYSLQKNALVSTTVSSHTPFGRVLLGLFKPALQYLVPLLLKRTITQLDA